MRITDQIFPTNLKYQSSTLLSKEYQLSNQVSSGLQINQASDDPATFSQVGTLKADLAQNQQYTAVTDTANDTTTATYNAVTQLQTIMSKVSELVTETNGGLGSSSYADVGAQMSSYSEQIANVLNTQVNGVYLFGGTGNTAPLIANTDPATSGYAPYMANPANTSETAQSFTINQDVTVKAGLTGKPDANGSSFMVSGTGATDIYSLVANLANDLNTTTSATTDPYAADTNLGSAYSTTTPAGSSYSLALQAVNDAVSNTSLYVGQTSAMLSRLSLNTNILSTAALGDKTSITDMTAADTAGDATDLTTVQTAYSAALSSASKILNMSLLNYLT